MDTHTNCADKIVTKTDKSEKLSLNTLESYIEMGEPHVNKVLNSKEVSDMEKTIKWTHIPTVPNPWCWHCLG